MVSQSARARKFALEDQDRCSSLNLEPLHIGPIAFRSLLNPTKDCHVFQPMAKAELHSGISFRQALVARLDKKWVVTTREHVTQIGHSNVDSEFSPIFDSWHFHGFGSCRRKLRLEHVQDPYLHQAAWRSTADMCLFTRSGSNEIRSPTDQRSGRNAASFSMRSLHSRNSPLSLLAPQVRVSRLKRNQCGGDICRTKFRTRMHMA